MTSFLRGLIVLATGSVVASASAGAQAAIITGPKAAAQRAVAATNAHTNAMQSPTASAPTTGRPAVTAPATAPTAKSGTPALATLPTKTVVHTGTPPTALAAAPAGKATAAPLKPVAPVVVAKGKPLPAGKAAAGPAADSEARSISVTERGVKGEVSLVREVYSYDPGGRRDPFASLLRTGDLRPMLSDLRLVVILYDPTGRNSIAIMRDVSTKDQYRVKVGQTIGRMRVAQIQPKEVVFTIEEVGFSRQEPLALGDSSTARTQ